MHKLQRHDSKARDPASIWGFLCVQVRYCTVPNVPISRQYTEYGIGKKLYETPSAKQNKCAVESVGCG